MTVNYQLVVSSVSPGTFIKLLLRWKGSIWKSVLWELLIWLFLYFSIALTYRYLFDAAWQSAMETLVRHIDVRMKYIPLTFMLGFFVSTVFERWRCIMNAMPFIESVAMSTSMLIPGFGESERIIRRTIIRYVVLAQVLVFRDISMRVRRRFPNLNTLIDAGFLEKNELEELTVVQVRPGNKFWVPMSWANSIILKAHEDKLIEQPTAFNNLILALKEFRLSLETLCRYDWIPIPLAYPQVVFLAVRMYFVLCLVSRQFVIHKDESAHQMDLVVPFMTILEFVFTVGWMKVAEGLLNPLGEDDDDFECNFIIDRNIATGMQIVDNTHRFYPPVVLDKFADPDFRPAYSEGSWRSQILAGSAASVNLAAADDQVKMVHIEPISSKGKKDNGEICIPSTPASLGVRARRSSLEPIRPSSAPNSPQNSQHKFAEKLSTLDEELDNSPNGKSVMEAPA